MVSSISYHSGFIVSPTTLETETCPIPILTKGTWIDRELNREFRTLYAMEIPFHPEWSAFPKDLALFFHQISAELDSMECTEDKPLEELDFDNRIIAIPHFSEVNEVLDLFQFNEGSSEKHYIPLKLMFEMIYSMGLPMKASLIGQETSINPPETTEDNCPIPSITEGEWLDIELNQNIRSLYAIELQNHPKFTSFPKDLALFFQEMHHALNTKKFTIHPLDDLRLFERMHAMPHYSDVNDILNFEEPDTIDISEKNNLPIKFMYWKALYCIFLKKTLIEKMLEKPTILKRLLSKL